MSHYIIVPAGVFHEPLGYDGLLSCTEDGCAVGTDNSVVKLHLYTTIPRMRAETEQQLDS